jgi:hypothetical protein
VLFCLFVGGRFSSGGFLSYWTDFVGTIFAFLLCLTASLETSFKTACCQTNHHVCFGSSSALLPGHTSHVACQRLGKILQRGKLSLAAEQRNVAYLMSVTRTSPGNVGHGYRHLSLLRMSCFSGHVASAYPAVNASWRRPSAIADCIVDWILRSKAPSACGAKTAHPGPSAWIIGLDRRCRQSSYDDAPWTTAGMLVTFL